jgi:hypothetical protein
MLEWLFGKKESSELPWYSALKAVPSRGIPDDLAAKESAELQGAEHEALQRELLGPPRRPADDAPLFTELKAESGLVTFVLPSGNQQCLLVFSTPFRAADYMRVQLASGPRAQYLVSSPLQLAKLLADLREVGVESLALDRCPRCPVFSVVSLQPSVDADRLLYIWAVHKASEMMRADLYLSYALGAARVGKLETARDVALQAIGHVTLEDPRLHFLLGQVALGLGDRTLLREARAFLTFLKEDSWRRQLDDIVRSGSPNFPGTHPAGSAGLRF